MTEAPIGFGFDLSDAAAWGLYVSEAIKEEETRYFTEPGLFLVKPDNQLFFGSVQSMPLARLPLEELISAIDFIKNENYRARRLSGL